MVQVILPFPEYLIKLYDLLSGNKPSVSDIFSLRSGIFHFSHVSSSKGGEFEVLKSAKLAQDEQKFSELYLPCHRLLVMYCLGFLKDEGLAENAASDTLLKFWNYEKLDEIRDVKTWLFVAAKNSCLNLINKTQRRRKIREDIRTKMSVVREADGEQQMMVKDIETLIRNTLNEKEAQIWNLHQEGYGNEEIAESLGMKEKTVANLKTIARKKLKERLQSQRG